MRRDGGVDAVALLAHQGFTGQFQEDALVGDDGRGGHEQALYRSAGWDSGMGVVGLASG